MITEKEKVVGAWIRSAEYWKGRVEFWNRIGNGIRANECKRHYENCILMLRHYGREV